MQKKFPEDENATIPLWLVRHAVTCWWNDTPIKGGSPDRAKLMDVLHAVAGSWRNPNRWIPVDERLPDLVEALDGYRGEGQKHWISKTVLVRRPYNEMSPHSMITLSEYRVFGNGRKLWTNGSQDVEAWMEIP